MAPRTAPIPVTVIGGFLGAGKTTLLNHILSADHGLRVAVLVNDFGAINIDAALVVGVDADVIDLANGCICCSIRDDLVGACLGLVQRPEQPDYLIVESSGVSNPVQIANTFLSSQLQQFLAVDSILCVVDGEQFHTLRGESADLARAQLAVADIAILNKTDLLDCDGLAEARALIGAISPGSPILEADHGRVPVELIVGTSPGCGARASLTPPDGADRPAHRGFTTWSWTSEHPLSLTKLRAVFEGLPDNVFRAKGVVHLEELPDYRVVLQKVGSRSSLKDAGRWGTQTPRSDLVLIGIEDGIDTEAMTIAFQGCIHQADEEVSPIVRLISVPLQSPP